MPGSCTASANNTIAKSAWDAVVATASRREGIRRQQSSRSSRRFMKFDNNELQDALLASELALSEPTSYHKHQFDSETVSTADVSSAEQSPEQSPKPACMASDADAWPSLREASSGWDFCSEGSDSEETWEALPEPALALEGVDEHSFMQSCTVGASWWLVAEGEEPTTSSVDQTDEVGTKPSFADLVRDQQRDQFPPASGTAKLPCRVEPVQRRARCILHAEDRISSEESEEPLLMAGMQKDARKRGHRVSWNTKHHCEENERFDE